MEKPFHPGQYIWLILPNSPQATKKATGAHFHYILLRTTELSHSFPRVRFGYKKHSWPCLLAPRYTSTARIQTFVVDKIPAHLSVKSLKCRSRHSGIPFFDRLVDHPRCYFLNSKRERVFTGRAGNRLRKKRRAVIKHVGIFDLLFVPSPSAPTYLSRIARHGRCIEKQNPAFLRQTCANNIIRRENPILTRCCLTTQKDENDPDGSKNHLGTCLLLACLPLFSGGSVCIIPLRHTIFPN